MKEHPRILTRNIAHDDQYQLSKYCERGGYQAVRKALAMNPAEVIEEVKLSGLRGRGGAGFPTGMKWGFVPKNLGKPIYLLNNADESEPGTFKDRLLLERDPHLIIEGMIIAAWALGAQWSAVYIRGEYGFPAERMNGALREAYAAGFLGRNIFGTDYNLDIVLHRGAGAYICGEETGLIESLEGNKGQPRLKPPFPAVVGLYGCPTVVNNTETLAALPWIFENGGKAYASFGTEKSPGTKLFSASGHINRPGVYEIELGYPVLEFLENECGGVKGGKKLKAVIVGGSSVPVLRAEELEGANLDYESLRGKGTMLGSGGFVALDETTDMVKVVANLQHFYAHESCGQCTPCREGAHWVEKIAQRILKRQATHADLALVKDVCRQIAGHTICPFGDALVTPVTSFIQKFPEEFEAYLDGSAAWIEEMGRGAETLSSAEILKGEALNRVDGVVGDGSHVQ